MFTLEELYSIKNKDFSETAIAKIEQMISEKEEDARMLPWSRYLNLVHNENVLNSFSYQKLEEFFEDPFIDLEYNGIDINLIKEFVKKFPGNYYAFDNFPEDGDLYFYIVSDTGIIFNQTKYTLCDNEDLERGFIRRSSWLKFIL